jgi:hypothetical protein
LVLLHGISNGHNDVLSGLGLALGVLLATTRLWWLAFTLLAAAALVKYSTVPLFPLFAWFLVKRHGLWRALLSVVPAAAFTACVVWPYVATGGAHKLAENLSNITDFIGSVGSIVVIPLRSLAPAEWEKAVANVLKLAGAMLVVGAVGWSLLRRRGGYTWAELLHDTVLVQLVLIVVASAKFYGWYLLMFWPVVGWLPHESRLRRVCVAIGFAQMGSLTAIARTHILYPMLLTVLPACWALRESKATSGIVTANPLTRAA